MADQRPIGYWLALVDRLIEERFALILEEHGVTRRQWQLLETLRRGPSPAAELDRVLAPFLRPPSEEEPQGEGAVVHLAELVESGWVAVEGELFSLTDRGAVATGRLEEVVGAERTAVMTGLTEEDYERTLVTLRLMAANLGWDDAA
ncbi:hypothetical protein SAMN06295885_0201 [Rathayibacter oskolensis]|uniref:DNA-binding transcriptional regulator, MarR family n=1 Tax=Rathayibacter oskolensis TaxID=1891671 RepID=A0A1X7MUM7_9MICO|nr:transcriptional regulator [Rathayibacter oskolensis]SMH28555.1 hypothetical protein SAMN06295885_0201 [Rathayibacter oskolensis]